jgi:CelD/BcsL family acetyltransferase involved in cellulose biosynthesis
MPVRVDALHVAEISDAEELVRLVPEWDELFSRTSSADPYLSPGWVLPWWHHLGGSQGSGALAGRAVVQACIVRRGDELVGVAPWMVFRMGVAPFAIDVVVGIGQETADYGGVLLGDDPDSVATALAEHLRPRLRSGRTVLAAARVRDGDPWLRALRSLDGVEVTAISTEVHPRIDLAAMPDPERWVSQMVKRNHVGRRRRRFGEAHGFAFAYDSDDVDAAMVAFRRLHEARWEAMEGEPDWLYRTDVGWCFLRDAASALHDRGLLRMSMVTAGSGAAVAGYLGFEHGGTYYAAKSGWDPEYARFGPGHLALGCALEHAAAAGLHTVDLMRGDGPHKQVWTSESESVSWWMVGRPGATGAAQKVLLRGALSLRHRRAAARPAARPWPDAGAKR